MRALFNGVENNRAMVLFKEADGSFELVLLEDNGRPIDLTGATVEVEIHAQETRATPVATLEAVVSVPLGGYCTVACAATDMTMGPNVFYFWAKVTGALPDELVSFGAQYAKVAVK